jgi:hypothetical protein
MKSLFICVVGCLTSFAVFAQTSANTVTINVTGNRNREVVVDQRSYPVTSITVNSTTAPTVSSIVIPDLQPGQHTLQVVRTNRNNATVGSNNTSTFNLRNGYDMLITVNNDGTLQMKETRIRNRGNGYANRYRTPMTDASYTTLLQNVQLQRGATRRMTAVNTAFSNPNNYFTTYQARQLIQLVNSENSRYQLAKTSYPRITDPANFSQLYDLLNSQSNRDALAAYVSSNANNQVYNNNNVYNNNQNNNSQVYNNGQYNTAMASANFNVLLGQVQNQWQPSAKITTISNAFANTNNFFTTDQVGQLIHLVNDENSRLQLAKSSYSHVTDKQNFNQLYDLFSTQAYRNELAAYVGSPNGNIYNNPSNTSLYKTPMTEASFNQLVEDVKGQWLPLAKMNALTNIFATPTNYFTADQARILIHLVSDEDNRLQLAKSSYRNITDRANYTLLYDLFNSQARKDALAAYVNSYRDSAGY